MIKVNRMIYAVLVMVLVLMSFSAWAANDTQVTGIHKAALDGDIAAVKTFLKKDPGLLQADGWHNKKPLHWAAQGGHKELVEFLIAQGAAVDSKNEANETPLHYAAARGHKEVAEFLVSKGADMNARCQWGTPVTYAVNSNHPDILKFFIEKGANVTFVEENGFTLLHGSAWEGSKEVIELLIAKGIPVDVKTKFGRTPLQQASLGGNVDAAKVLISKGADVNYKGEEDWPPLYLAAKRGHTDLVSLLLESGASVDIRHEKSQRTPLHLAALNGFGGIAASLLEKGADPNAADVDGKTPLYYACRYGQGKVAKLLLSKGAEWSDEAKKEKEMNNFAFSPLLQKEFKPGSALTWYLGHSSWAIKTANHFLVFDYSKQGTQSDTPLLANGTINPEEIKDLNVTVFVSHEHGDHYLPAIFDWKKDVKNITYILGFKPEDKTDYMYIGPRETKAVNGMEITTIECNDSGVAFFVKVDGVNVFHSGDHANRKQDFSEPFKEEIDFLAEKGLKPDIFFAPVSGCGFGDIEAVKKGVYYTLKRLNPGAVVPMHAGGSEERYLAFAEETKKAGFDTPVCCPAHGGDWFFVDQGNVKKARMVVVKNGDDVNAAEKKADCKSKKGDVKGCSQK